MQLNREFTMEKDISLVDVFNLKTVRAGKPYLVSQNICF